MWFKILTVIGIVLTPTSFKKAIVLPFIFTEGYIETSDIQEPVQIHFTNFLQINKDKNYTFQIYENQQLKSSTKVKGSEIGTSYTLNYLPFNFYRDFKAIQIKILYENEDSVLSDELTIYSCEKSAYTNSSANTKLYSIQTPTITRFKIGLNSQYNEVSYEYETISTTGIATIYQDYNRYISFKGISLYVNSSSLYEMEEISSATLRIYTAFENSDFKKPSPNSVDIEFALEQKNKWFYLIDEYRFYQDQYDGTIYENYNPRCGETLHSFFIPQNCSEKKILYAIIFSNIGINKSTFYVRGQINIGRTLWGDSNSKYYYEEMDTPLSDVEYEQ